MKLRIEIDEEGPEEIVIRAHSAGAELMRIKDAIDAALKNGGEIAVRKNGEERFLRIEDLLFFETNDNRVWAHSAKDCCLCPMRLSDLEEKLPRNFVRGSKGCLINIQKIRSITRSPTGVGRASFKGCEKVAYISRMYYKSVHEIIEETRLKK